MLSKKDFRIEGRLKTPNATNIESDLDENPLAYFPMNEGTGIQINDVYNVTRNGTFVQTPIWNGNSFNSEGDDSINFDRSGSSDYISIPTGSELTFGNNGTDRPFSIEIWVRDDSDLSGDHTIFSKTQSGAFGEYGFKLNDDSNTIRFFIASPIGSISVSGNLVTTEWNHVVGTYNANKTKEGLNIYINGQIPDSVIRLSPSGFTNYTSYPNSVIWLNDHDSSGFDGDLDEFRIWNKSLVVSEALTLYNNYWNGTGLIQTIIGIENAKTSLNLSSFGAGIIFESFDNNPNSNLKVKYGFTTDGVLYSNHFFNITKNIWIRFSVDVDLFRSAIEFKMTYDNKTAIDESDKTILDISTSIQPNIFNSATVKAFFGSFFSTSGSTSWKLDFLKGPYEEFKFDYLSGTQTVSSDWIPSEFSTYGLAENGSLTQVRYANIVPEFDSVSATLKISTYSNDSADYNYLTVWVSIIVQNVDKTNGAITTVSEGNLLFYEGYPMIVVNSYNPTLSKSYQDSSEVQSASAGYSCYTNAEGNRLTTVMNLNGYVLSSTTNSTGFSSEYRVQIHYYFGYRFSAAQADSEYFTAAVTDFDLIYRDLFGFLPDAGDFLGINGFLKFIITPFLIGIRAIGSFLAVIMEPIAELLRPLANILNSIVSEVQGIAASVADELESFFTTLGTVITSLATLMWTQLGSALSTLIPIIFTFIGAGLTALFNALDPFIDELSSFLSGVWNYIWTAFFAGTFGDLLGLFNTIWGFLPTMVSWLLTGYSGLVAFACLLWLGVTFYIFFPSSHDEGSHINGIISNFTKNIFPDTAIFGTRFPVPLGLIWFIGSVFYGLASYFVL